MKRKKVVIFISGSGSNMEALVEATRMPDYPAHIVAVISDQKQAAGVEKAKRKNIPVHVIEREKFVSKQQYEEAILQCLAAFQPDVLCFAGYMRLVSCRIINAYKGRILNIHPSLLPLFPGLDTHRRAIASGMKITGCTVHIVTEEMDNGPVLAQAAVPVCKGDDEKTLANRVLKAEHRLYPVALAYFITQKKKSKKNQILLSF